MTIRLAPKYVQRKFDRMPHKHIASHRAEYVGHALTIIQAFLRHGQRDGTLTPSDPMMSGRDFAVSRSFGREPDPASSLIEQVRDNTDNEALGVFLKVWRDLYGNESMMTREVLADVPRKQNCLRSSMNCP